MPPLNLYARVRFLLCNLAHETAGISGVTCTALYRHAPATKMRLWFRYLPRMVLNPCAAKCISKQTTNGRLIGRSRWADAECRDEHFQISSLRNGRGVGFAGFLCRLTRRYRHLAHPYASPADPYAPYALNLGQLWPERFTN